MIVDRDLVMKPVTVPENFEWLSTTRELNRQRRGATVALRNNFKASKGCSKMLSESSWKGHRTPGLNRNTSVIYSTYTDETVLSLFRNLRKLP